MSYQVLGDGIMGLADSTTSVARPKRMTRKAMLWAVLSCVVAAAILGQLSYTYSGSGKWEFMERQKGVTVYSMKTPGENARKFFAVFRIKSTLNQAVAFMQDDDSDVSDVGFYDSRILKQESSLVRWTTWKMRLPAPMTDREFVVRHSFSQDPTTKEVLYTLDSANELVPQDKCCVRVKRMANRWSLVPVGNGEVEIRWVMDVDFGGWIPYFAIDRHLSYEMVDFGSSLQEVVDRKKYIGARTGWVEE